MTQGQKPKKVGRKFTKAKRQQIIHEGIDMILFSHITWEGFQKWIRETHTIKDSNPYWKECWTNITNRFEEEKDQLVKKHLHHLYDLHKRCIENSDRSTERATLVDIAKILGIQEGQKLTVNSEDGKIEITLDLGD
tara:strand:- start:4785 stop:5192 length:408 start_codon:yes stop_codon:yes gene_type:complete